MITYYLLLHIDFSLIGSGDKVEFLSVNACPTSVLSR